MLFIYWNNFWQNYLYEYRNEFRVEGNYTITNGRIFFALIFRHFFHIKIILILHSYFIIVYLINRFWNNINWPVTNCCHPYNIVICHFLSKKGPNIVKSQWIPLHSFKLPLHLGFLLLILPNYLFSTLSASNKSYSFSYPSFRYISLNYSQILLFAVTFFRTPFYCLICPPNLLYPFVESNIMIVADF